MDDPNWLKFCREVQAIAQNGLTFCKNPYDEARYRQLRTAVSQLFGTETGISADAIAALFAQEAGYATPKIDVRAAVFDRDDRILMVRETIDAARWTLPGGWADVNLTTAENAVKEVEEESGYHVAPIKLAAVWDRARQGHGPELFSCAKFFYLCDLQGGTPRETTDETSGTGWFHEHDIPSDLSTARVTAAQISRMFAHRRCPELPTDYE